jgi:hypothetical protein
MAKYSVAFPQQEVRLRNWPAGRVSEMKLMISRLEQALNQTLGGQVLQSAKRKFNDQIPFILDLSVDAGYRQFVIKFSTPPGLNSTHPDRQLLFYEIQHDSAPNFSDPIIIENPNTNVVISGVGLGETRFFRARTINTKFQASRWTSTLERQAAKGEIIQTKIADASVRLTEDVGVWQTIFSKTYEPVDGAITLNAHIALGCFPDDVTDDVTADTYNSGPAHVQFRWLSTQGGVDSEIGPRTLLSGRPKNEGSANEKVQMPFGTFMSPFYRFGTTETTFKLQAAKTPGSEWKGLDGSGTLTISDPLVFSRNSIIIEVLEEF